MAKKSEETDGGLPELDLGNDRIKAILDSYLTRWVPSLLFTGPEGVGKEYAALTFAKRLLCESESPCGAGETVCDSCRKIQLLEHPGLHLVYPTPSRGSAEKEDDDAEDIGKVIEEKRRDIFSAYRFPKKVTIRIARARAIIQRANTKPFGSSHNVFILVNAHAMREGAQNALLKLVEEPPDRSILIWVTPNPDAILYTIRSRCQQVRFSPLKPDLVEEVLVTYYGIDRKVAHKSADLSQGSIVRARELSFSYDDKEKRAAYDLLANVLDEPESRVIERASDYARGAGRDSAALLLHELSLAYRDMMCSEKELFINRDQTTFLLRQIRRWDRKKLPWILERISSAREGVLRRNLNIEATFVDLFLAIKRAGC